jgi:hypothetical protein
MIGTDLVFNTESVPSNISYKSFRTSNLAMQNSYCDHRNVNQPLIVLILFNFAPRSLLYAVKISLVKKCHRTACSTLLTSLELIFIILQL